MTDKPFSPACERNREPILAVLRDRFAGRRHVLEIGSGTGQHAVHFAAAMPWLRWQCSDRAEALPGMRLWLDEAARPNLPPPLALDLAAGPWPPSDPALPFDAAFTANTLHIVGWPEVRALFTGLAALLPPEAPLVSYGPFAYDGAHTSDSNRDFDAWLRARDPRSGVRDLAALRALAQPLGWRADEDVAMPANNRCLVWRRTVEPPRDS